MAKNIEVSIVIPCLDEKKTIKKVIEDAYKNAKKVLRNKFEIIIADNGSKDGSIEIIKKTKKASLINVPVKGYGAALHWGIMKSRGKYVLFGDADLSYPFSNLDKFVDRIIEKPDLVLGTRLKGKIKKGAMPFLHRYIGTPVLTFMIRAIYRIPTTDCNSGMRLVKRSFYKRLNMRNSGMEWASELLLKTALKKGNYLEVPITFNKDKRGRPPHLSSWSDGWRHLKSILLLKPVVLYPFVPIFLFLALVSFGKSFGLTFLFLNMSFVLFLCLIALNFLSINIENRESKLSKFLKEFRFVQLTFVTSFLVAVIILFIPDSRLGTKLFLVSLLSTIFMWVFLIETIKTHLTNRLPDLISRK